MGRPPPIEAMESKNGDGQDLGEILEELRPRLEHLIAIKMDPRLRRRIDPDDVIQGAYLDVVRRYEEWVTMHSPMPFYCWVRLLTLQKLAEFHRRHIGTLKRDVRREVHGAGPGSTTATPIHTLVAHQESPSKVFQRHEWEDSLHGALERMKPTDREILELRHFERLSNAECAGILGLTCAGAKVRHMRAAKRLRLMLACLDLPEELIPAGRLAQ